MSWHLWWLPHTHTPLRPRERNSMLCLPHAYTVLLTLALRREFQAHQATSSIIELSIVIEDLCDP